VKLSFSAESRRDLRAIARFGAKKFGEIQSKAYAELLAQSLRILQSSPHLAVVKPGYHRPIRVHPVGAHLIVYELRETEICVVRVLHGHQNLADHI
jgi:toxin ParE1/3/4